MRPESALRLGQRMFGHPLKEVKFLRQYVGHQPIILPGSVVLILNNANEVLLQKRYDGGWGLPGGLKELGESLEDTAKREVLEKTGLVIEDLKLLDIFSGPEYNLKAVFSKIVAVKDRFYLQNV